MTPPPAPSRLSRSELLAAPGTLLVLRGGPAAVTLEEPAAASPEPGDPDLQIFIAVAEDGSVTAFNGHVDLGTGIATALAQIVAEELDVPLHRVATVLGHTGQTPNQGATIASETIQVAAIPLRQAAATARHALVARAAGLLDAPADALAVVDGVVGLPGGNRHLSYGELVAGQRIRLVLDRAAALKPSAEYRIVGHSAPRIDIPAKATGTFTYVHDVRVPGMLHGRVVRPPYAGLDAGPFVGSSLLSVDEASVAGVPGLVATVVIRDFVGVVAEREENAVEAARRLNVSWRGGSATLPDLERPEQALRAHPSRLRVLLDRGDVEGAVAGAATPMPRTYVWPYQMHGSVGPSCAVADCGADRVVVWSGTQNPHLLRADLARLLGMAEHQVEVVRHEAAGCYGRNCADDVSADAALLSRAVGRPVRVQLSREQEHAWEPKGAAQVMDVRGALDAAGGVAAYDFATRYPSNGAPTLALLLTGTIPPVPEVFEMGDRTAIPPYAFPAMRVTVHDMAPIVRASWLRGVSALPNSFAHESWIDECATEARADPVEYRLRHLPDERGAALVRAVAERAGWTPRTAPGSGGGEGDLLFGRGFAYAVYVHGRFPGTAAAWSAWVADVAVNRRTGEVAVTKVTAGQDTGQMVNPAGVRHQIQGNVVQSVSRALVEQVRFDGAGVTSREWGAYPILTFPQVPAIDVVLMPRQDAAPLGAGESASVPSAAAIANAVFDATGVRFRELPLTPERVRAGLGADAAPPEPKRRRRWWGALAGALFGAAGMAATLLPWRPAYAPVARPDPAAFSAATIERGRRLAGLGACAACHTGPELARFGGGLPLDTPFGRVWSTNISPSPKAGIGAWSYPAFERAMREGVSRDGHHLYPAHPYTSFAGSTDADLQALYAHLMAQPAVDAAAPATRLAFPFRVRPLMAAWNALFLRRGAWRADLARTDQWNRGAYLVETLGHCSACHSPRNALGAEKEGGAHLAGGMADGWEAPPLTAASHAPVPWTAGALYDYLRTGEAAAHGSASGPMATVVAGLAALPDADIRAMAAYLASVAGREAALDEAALARAAEARSPAMGIASLGDSTGARLYAGACAACHEAGGLVSLALHSSLHSARPDNLAQAVLRGVAGTRTAPGHMPAYADSLNDRQVADLLAHLRARFAPDKPAWAALERTVAKVRRAGAGR